MARTTAEIAAEAEAIRAGAKAEEGDVVEEEEEGDDQQAGGDPPGFMSYDEWVKAGKDPDLFEGKKAYEEKHGLIKKFTDLKKDFRAVSQSVNDTMEEWRNGERTKLKAELAAQYKDQRDQGMVDEAVETKQALVKIEQEEKKGKVAQLPPVITDFIEATPLIDLDSKDFSPEVFEDFKLVYDAAITKLTNGTGLGLSDRQIKRALDNALAEAKELNKELFPPARSPRNDRPGQSRTGAGNRGEGGKGGQSIEVRLKNLKFGDNRNAEGNPHPAHAIYLKLKESNPKAAERYARNLLEG
jgi:hypothetical protein